MPQEIKLEAFLVFVIVACATIVSPGPGVVLTLSNSIRFGAKGAMGGIFGIATGTFLIAGLSATSLGIILATSSLAFTVMKYLGAAYLIYLGVKLWRSPPREIGLAKVKQSSWKRQFTEGFLIQVSNPKAVFFFISIFPQFVDFTKDHFQYFAILVITYSTLVICIHSCYAFLAKSARGFLATKKGNTLVNKLSGGTFVCFGLGLASASK